MKNENIYNNIDKYIALQIRTHVKLISTPFQLRFREARIIQNNGVTFEGGVIRRVNLFTYVLSLILLLLSIYGQDAHYTTTVPFYTKLDANGNDLPISAVQWAMVGDNVTGLIWEVITNIEASPITTIPTIR